jgi:hypothetical protein
VFYDICITNNLTLTASLDQIRPGRLNYSYDFTLDEDSEVPLFVWYKVIAGGSRVFAQDPVDSLGIDADEYTGSGSIDLTEFDLESGDDCNLFVSVGHMVYGPGEDPPSMLHGDYTERFDFDFAGVVLTDVTEETDGNMPQRYAIQDIRPNPFNPSTSFDVTLPDPSHLTIVVYNISGQRVATIADEQFGHGTHSFTFTAENLASGLYLVHAVVPDRMNEIRKLTLLR